MVSLPGPLKENAWRVVFFCSALVVGLSLTWTTAVGRSPLWQLLFWYAVILIATSAFTSSSSSFFLGKTSSISLLQSLEARVRGKRAEAKEGAADADARQHVSFWVLMPSAFITWIFAKSIYNSAVLAGKYGILGGFSPLPVVELHLHGRLLRPDHSRGVRAALADKGSGEPGRR